MGNSSNARFSDGRELYDTKAAVPAAVRKAWTDLIDRSVPAATATAGALTPGPRPRVPVPVRASLRLLAKEGIPREARAAGLDPAEVALLMDADDGSLPARRARLGVRIRVLRVLEARIHAEVRTLLRASKTPLGEGTRLHIRTWVLDRVRQIHEEELPRKRSVVRWMASPGGRRALLGTSSPLWSNGEQF